MARLPIVYDVRTYLKSAAGRGLPVWLRTALVTWQWPSGFVPDERDFSELVTCLRLFVARTQRTSNVRARRARNVTKYAV
jgi:hypothetical protein